MAAHDLGVRIDTNKGIAFFGFQEVNERIKAGAKVVELRPGSVVWTKTEPEGAPDEKVRLTLAGCQFQIVLADS